MKKNGFTLIELLIVVAILGVVCVIAGSFFLRCGASGEEAEKSARAWAAKMGYTLQGVSCVDRDTDGDGYVSCTLVTVADPGRPIALECARSTSMNSGCRLQKPVAPNGSY